MPIDLPLKWLRRNDDPMKTEARITNTPAHIIFSTLLFINLLKKQDTADVEKFPQQLLNGEVR